MREQASNCLRCSHVPERFAVAAEEALDEFDASVAPARAAEQLAAAGFGPKTKSTADDVLARLKAKLQSGAAA